MSGRPWLSPGFFLSLLAALLLMIAVSCGTAATPTPSTDAAPDPTATPTPPPEATTPAETEAPEAGPYGTLTTSFERLQAYGPHTRYRPGTSAGNIAMAGHEGLFQLDKDSIYRGLMVKEWSVAPDNRTWTFKLHEGIQFHGDWGPMTPEDVHQLRQGAWR